MTYSIIATCTQPLTHPPKSRQPRIQAGADLDSLLHLSKPNAASSASTSAGPLRVKDTEAVMRAVAAFADHPQVLQVRRLIVVLSTAEKEQCAFVCLRDGRMAE